MIRLRKYTVGDIQIKTNAEMITEAILEKYDSLDSFLVVFGKSKRYFLDNVNHKHLGSAQFKIKLLTVLDKGFESLLLSENEQLSKIAEDIEQAFGSYSEDDDMHTLKALTDLCLSKGLAINASRAYKLLGNYHQKRKESDSAKQAYETAIALAKSKNAESLLFESYCELGFLLFRNAEFNNSIAVYTLAENMLYNNVHFDNKLLYKYYYRVGLYHNHEMIGQFRSGCDFLEHAIKYTEDKIEIGKLYLNIGFSYKKQHSYERAQHYYDYAIRIFGDENIRYKCQAYNNKADLYMSMGNLNKALEFINLAMADLEHCNTADQYVMLQTYVEIKYLRKEDTDLLDEFIAMTENASSRGLDIRFKIMGLHSLLNCGMLNKTLLIRMGELINSEIEKIENKEHEHAQQLFELLEKIQIKMESGDK